MMKIHIKKYASTSTFLFYCYHPFFPPYVLSVLCTPLVPHLILQRIYH